MTALRNLVRTALLLSALVAACAAPTPVAQPPPTQAPPTELPATQAPTQVPPTPAPPPPTQPPTQIPPTVAPSAPGVDAESDRDGVFTVREGRRNTLRAPGRDVLGVGDGVDVDEAGRAILRFADLLTVEILRDGELTVQELAAEEQAAVIRVLQTGGAIFNNFNPTQEAGRRLVVQTDFAIIEATGTSFAVIREANTPLEWVLGLDAGQGDLMVTAGGQTSPVVSGQARWIAPIGGPSPGINADVLNAQAWIDNVRNAQPVREFGEVVWPHADVVADTASLEGVPEPGQPFDLQGGAPGSAGLMLDPAGPTGDATYARRDCNGDGIQDLYIRSGTVIMDFRSVLARVRALDVSVVNLAEPGAGALLGFNPGREQVAAQELAVGQGQGQVLGMRVDEPLHYAELQMADGCLLGYSLTPPDPDGNFPPPRPAVEVLNTAVAVPEAPTIGPVEVVTVQVPSDGPVRRLTPTPTPDLPLYGGVTRQPPPGANVFAEIVSIGVLRGRYIVEFRTAGFEPAFGRMHVHFFFDTVAPEDAGAPGRGPWHLYPATPNQSGASPFTMLTTADRPDNAGALCILVANPDHSVIQGTGNCMDLP